VQLAGFRLHPNVPVSTSIRPLDSLANLHVSTPQLPEKYRILNSTPTRKHKKKDKKHKYDNNIAQDLSTSEQPGDTHEKKHKKGKRHDDDKERKKRKKEKKRKKQSKHSPDHPSSPNAMET
jgi:mediator of RNA polymerase II transcription subunit 19